MKQEIAKQIHPLCDESEKGGKIFFIDDNGVEHSFSSCINSLSGDRLSWFDSDAPTVYGAFSWVKSIVKNIKNKFKVVKTLGDF